MMIVNDDRTDQREAGDKLFSDAVRGMWGMLNCSLFSDKHDASNDDIRVAAECVSMVRKLVEYRQCDCWTFRFIM